MLTDLAVCIKCPEDQWSSYKHERCFPRFTEFLSNDDSLGAIFTAISTCCCLVTISVLCLFVRYHDTPIVKANNRELSYLLLLSLMLCFLSSLIFIGRPTAVTCMLRQVVFSTVFCFCIACVLAKSITVVIAFNATKPESKLRKWMGPRTAAYVLLLSLVIQVLIDAIWLATAPPFVEKNMKSTKDKIVIECNEGSGIMFYCMLGYLGVLGNICFIVAFLARKLPDSFNEAKYITFSMLSFISVWVSFVPAYLSAKGIYSVAVEIFAILSSSAGLLCCIFLPKCYIILLKPDMNTRAYLMQRGNIPS
ncbi:vomeronasal type-2 receptor 26-like [Protopterus annectens]|uniref:vomeronasal type-2 receptor 26-like n=1 Tax=Protopterus annectens TaxID=7888 RepID=UPI001CF94CEB|nr:vomeronasal type-2 receptor 26-like [Protopterus annectens]